MLSTRHKSPVVVGLEDSKSGWSALEWAAAYAGPDAAEFVLVHAYPDIAGLPRCAWGDLDRELTAEAKSLASKAGSFLRDTAGPVVVTKVVVPHAPVPLLRDRSEGAWMVVVGRREPGGVLSKLVGSTSYSLAEHAAAPVVVVPESWTVQGRLALPVYVGLNGLDDDAAVSFAADLARLHGAPLIGVRVLPLTFVDDQVAPGDRERWLQEHRMGLQSSVRDGLDGLELDTDVEIEIELGRPADALLARADRAGVVVIGGRPRQRILPTPLGAISRTLLRHAACPVAIAHSLTEA
jgi:nucleotide-binding universal stress UspA family protein